MTKERNWWSSTEPVKNENERLWTEDHGVGRAKRRNITEADGREKKIEDKQEESREKRSEEIEGKKEINIVNKG